MQTAAWGLRRSLGKRSRILLLLIALLSAGPRTAVVALLGVVVDRSGVTLGVPDRKLGLIPNSSLEGHVELVDVHFFLVYFLHIFQSLKVLSAGEFEAHGVD